ncbi:hypothetical protein [Nitrosococcus watsonii]
MARIDFGMLNSTSESEMPEESWKEAVRMDDAAFTPLAMPCSADPSPSV